MYNTKDSAVVIVGRKDRPLKNINSVSGWVNGEYEIRMIESIGMMESVKDEKDYNNHSKLFGWKE